MDMINLDTQIYRYYPELFNSTCDAFSNLLMVKS